MFEAVLVDGIELEVGQFRHVGTFLSSIQTSWRTMASLMIARVRLSARPESLIEVATRRMPRLGQTALEVLSSKPHFAQR